MSDTPPPDSPTRPVTTPPNDGRRRRFARTALVWGCGAVMGAVVVAVIGVAVLAYANLGTIGQRFGPSCTLGLNGTTETLTIQGWDARTQCEYWLKDYSQYGPGYYEYQDGTPQTPILCQVVYENDVYTVRGLSQPDSTTSEDFCVDLAHLTSP